MHSIALHRVTDGKYGTFTLDSDRNTLAFRYRPHALPSSDGFIRVHPHHASQVSERYGLRMNCDDVLYVVEGPQMALQSQRGSVPSLLDGTLVALLNLPSVELVRSYPSKFFRNCRLLFKKELEELRFFPREIAEALALLDRNAESITGHLPLLEHN